MIVEDVVSDEEIKAFKRDGAVVLRSRFSEDWLALLRDGIDA